MPACYGSGSALATFQSDIATTEFPSNSQTAGTVLRSWVHAPRCAIARMHRLPSAHISKWLQSWVD